MVDAGPLAAMQHIAPQFTGQQQMVTTHQPGTTETLTDPTSTLTNMQAHAIERPDLHKGVKALEGVLISLDEYRELKGKLAKCEKKLAKGLNEMGKAKAFEEVPSKTLQAASDIFDARMDVSCKQAKLIQKEYEALNDHCAKYFKRIAKEEKTFDDQLETLDSKIKKAHASHDKNAKKGGRSAIESHDKFIQSIQALTAEATRLKASHSSSVGTKTFLTSLMVASAMGGLADAEYKALCESVRKSGQHVGKLNEWLNFTINDAMAKSQPIDLNDDGSGLAQRIAAKEAEIREELRRREQARLKQLEDEHAMLKLQQMGWTPPTKQSESAQALGPASPSQRTGAASPSAERPATSMTDLPKLDSNGNLVEAGKQAQPSPPSPADLMGKANSGSHKPSEPDAAKAGTVQPPISPSPQHRSFHHQQSSSVDEGTVIIKDAVPEKKDTAGPANDLHPLREESKETSTPAPSSDESNVSLGVSSGMSLSASNSSATSKGSEDSSHLFPESKSAGPLTPIEEKADDVIVRGVDDGHEGFLGGDNVVGEASDHDDASAKRSSTVQFGPHYADRPAERSKSTDADQASKGNPASRTPDSPQRRREEQEARASLWERERERERQVELERRLAEAESRLRVLDRNNSSARQVSTGGGYGDGYERSTVRGGVAQSLPRYTEPTQNFNRPSGTSRRDDEIPASRYEPDRYAPAVGGSRLSGPSVTRSLSTDSERSFVARMKAMYQAEKGDKTQQHEQTGRRRSPADQEVVPTSPRRVSELANVYSSGRNTGYAGQRDGRTSQNGHYDASTTPLPSRARYDSAPSQRRPSSAADRHKADEFGRQESREAMRRTNEPPHASSCGCWNCSARHYRAADGQTPTSGASISMATTKAGVVPPHPPPRHPNASTNTNNAHVQPHPPPNYRRQTMQVPPSDTGYDKAQAGGRGLAAPDHVLYARRSFEDEPGRRVVFAKEHGTIR